MALADKLALEIEKETFPIRGTFRIARGSKTEAAVIRCTVKTGGIEGHGECVPYARYGETLESVENQLRSLELPDAAIEDIRPYIQTALPAGAARNAIDCALWDLAAKQTGKAAHRLICANPPRPLETAYTLSLDTPDAMADAARAASTRSLLKIKLGGDDDIACMHAVVANAPNSRIIIDANEGWSIDRLTDLLHEASLLKIALIEQPLPVGQDAILAEIPHPVPICADESAHTSEDLEDLGGRYDFVNIKLDKTGGLTEAIRMRDRAVELGFGIMVGCMVGTSLAMAPGVYLAQEADFVDLDGPLLLARDRPNGLHYYGSTVSPPETKLWG